MKNKIFKLLVIVTIFLTGCANTANDNEETKRDNKEINGIEYVYDKSTEISKDPGIAFGEKGYYYLINGILHFYDIYSDVDIPVCSRTDCFHDASSCDAYALDKMDYDPYDLSGVTVNCLGNMIWYSDGKLYMIRRDESGDYLMQYDSDFTNEVKLTAVAENGTVLGLPGKNTTDTALMYNGYLYYFSVTPTKASELIDYTTTITCNRIKVDKDAKVEVLGTFDMAIDYSLWGAISGGKICAGDKAVYFVAGGTVRGLSPNDPVQYRICYYDSTNGSFTTVLNKNTDDTKDVLGYGTGHVQNIADDIVCVDDENNIYIVTDECKIVKITQSGESKVIYSNPEAKITELTWDGTYIYLYEQYIQSGSIVRMDKQGIVKGEYAFVVSKEFCEENGISGTLNVDIDIRGIDAQNVLISTTENYIKGIECKDVMEGKYPYNGIYVVGFVGKKAFDGESVPIKSVYIHQ